MDIQALKVLVAENKSKYYGGTHGKYVRFENGLFEFGNIDDSNHNDHEWLKNQHPDLKCVSAGCYHARYCDNGDFLEIDDHSMKLKLWPSPTDETDLAKLLGMIPGEP